MRAHLRARAAHVRLPALRSVVLTTALLLALCAGAARATPGEPGAGSLVELSGSAFGTTWHVRLVAQRGPPAPAALASEIRSVLDAVDAHMSTWRDDSEISRFNASRSTGWYSVAPETARAVREALEVHRLSGHAFDPTVAPLVALWGFGATGSSRRLPPAAAEIRAVLPRVDAGKLRVRDDPPALRKVRSDLSLDLSGVGKGYAVDAVARRLEALGLRQFLVEVGGELRGRGEGPMGGPWRVGIERPEPGAGAIGWVVALADASLATSGDYRRFFEWEGRRRSHVIDPRSGRPVEHDLVSVSVLAAQAARADAWATALLVLGPEAGWRVAEREGLAVLFVRDRGGRLEARGNPALDWHRVR